MCTEHYACSILLYSFYDLFIWYVSNLTLHTDLRIPFVTEEIRRLYRLYHSRLGLHPNNLTTDLASPPLMVRRLLRRWPTDLLRDPMAD